MQVTLQVWLCLPGFPLLHPLGLQHILLVKPTAASLLMYGSRGLVPCSPREHIVLYVPPPTLGQVC